MGVDSHHPLYDENLPDWELLRDSYKGERQVKSRGRSYLPATAGMVLDGMSSATDKGQLAYAAYVTRAVFPEFVKEATEAMLGVMHNKPAVIEVPPIMEPLLEKATLRKESLEMLLRRINEEQLSVGRLGLIADVVEGTAEKLPYIAMYYAEDVINWDEGSGDGTVVDMLNLVVLDESTAERQPDGFEWKQKRKFRVLVRGDPTNADDASAKALYQVGEFREDTSLTFSSDKLVTPSLSGRTLNRIPFVFVNAKDIVPAPDKGPLLGLANIGMAVYRGEADYRQALFMQGQDTLVVIGGDENATYRIGANGAIFPPIGGNAEFIGVNSEGLSEMRSALENDHARAGRKAGELISDTSKDRESGDALRIRVASRTATLNQIAQAGAFALQEILRIIAEWVGADPTKVTVKPNLDFADAELLAADLVQLMTAKSLGAPISLESIHDIMLKRGMTEQTFEEEVERITAEKDLGILPEPATDPNGPAEDAPPGGDSNAPPTKKVTPAPKAKKPAKASSSA